MTQHRPSPRRSTAAGPLTHTVGPPHDAMRRCTLWLVVASACWGVDTTLSEYALRALRPADLLFVQTVVGASGLWLMVIVTGTYRRLSDIRPYLRLGLLEPGAAYLLLDLGLRRTNAISGGILLSTETIFAVALGAIVLQDKFAARTAIALVAGVTGSALVLVATGHTSDQTLAGDLLVLSGSAIAATYYLVAPTRPADDNALTGTATQLLASVAVALAFATWTWSTQGSALPAASAGHLWAAGAAGVIGISIPFFLLNRSLTATTTSAAALILNLSPVFAVGSAVFLLGEHLSPIVAVGGLTIVLGLLVLAGSGGVVLAPEGAAP